MSELGDLNTYGRHHLQGILSIGGGIIYISIATSIHDSKKLTLECTVHTLNIVSLNNEVPSNI